MPISVVVRPLTVYVLVGALTVTMPAPVLGFFQDTCERFPREAQCADDGQARPHSREIHSPRSLRDAVNEAGLANVPQSRSRADGFNARWRQQSSPPRKSKKGAVIATFVGLGMMAGAGAMIAAHKEPSSDPNCGSPPGGQQYINCYPDLSEAYAGPSWRDAGVTWLAIGAVVTGIGLIGLR